MQLKIRITTPKGQASGTKKTLEPFLLGSQKKLISYNTYVNDEDSEMFWEIETDPRRALKITRNVGLYKEMINMVLGNKKVKKMVKDEAQKEELEMMLKDQTKIEILSEATAEEMVEANKSFWQRIKEKYKKN